MSTQINNKLTLTINYDFFMSYSKNPENRSIPQELKKYIKFQKAVSIDASIRPMLNKLSEDNYSAILSEILELDLESNILKLINLIFEKAISEKKYINIYSKLCSDLGQISNFKREYLNKLHQVFDKIVNNNLIELFMTKDQIINYFNLLGESFNLNMITEQVITSCLDLLIDKHVSILSHPIENIFILITTVCKNKKYKNYNNILVKLKEIKDTVITVKDKFLLMDLLEIKN